MKKVLIIGAGPAGLTAGYQILKNSKEYKVIILEKDSQVGGISKTVTYNGNKMDLGGHRFFTKNKEVQKLWESLLLIQNKPSIDEIILKEEKDYPKKGANPEKSDKVFLKRRRISRIYYNNKFFDYPVNLSFKTVKNLGIKDTFISGCSYIKSSVKKLPEDSLENFYINRFGKILKNCDINDYKIEDNNAQGTIVLKLKYTDKKDPTETTGNAKTYSNKLKAFLDTYNNTYESSKASRDSNLKQAASSMKSLVKKYKNELEEVGITIDKDGYLKKSSSSKIETTKPFEDLFGKKSNFLQELDRIPNRIKNHVDILI